MDLAGKEAVIKGNFDVIVVGGGIAGVSAAVSAARNNMNTLLIEKSINLGGMATGGLISWYEPLCDGRGNQVIFGIAEELIKLSAKYGFDNLPEQWGGSEDNEPSSDRYSTFFSPAVFAVALDEFVTENNVTIRFDSRATYPVMEGSKCRGIIVESADGREFFGGKVIIDASGDAAVMDRAGVPTICGENYMTYVTHFFTSDMFSEQKKDMCKIRKWLNTGSDMFGVGHPEGKGKMKGVTAEEITEYVIEGKRNLLSKIKAWDKNSFDIMSLPQLPQFRTIRRIEGKCDFTAEDKRSYADSIGQCGDFRPNGRGKIYQIPMGALYNESFDNLIAAGRIISSPQGDGWEVARVIPVCAMTGEAAGKMAAVCVEKNCTLNDLSNEDVKKIRIS